FIANLSADRFGFGTKIRQESAQNSPITGAKLVSSDARAHGSLVLQVNIHPVEPMLGLKPFGHKPCGRIMDHNPWKRESMLGENVVYYKTWLFCVIASLNKKTIGFFSRGGGRNISRLRGCSAPCRCQDYNNYRTENPEP